MTTMKKGTTVEVILSENINTDEFVERFTKLEAKLEANIEISKKNSSDIKELDRTIRGNDGIGIRGKQEIIDTRLKSVEKLLNDNKKIMIGVAVSVLILLVESLWQIVTHMGP